MTASANIKLLLDDGILRKLKKKDAKLVVLGCHLSGLSSTKKRIEEERASFGDCWIRDTQLSDKLDLIVKQTNEARKQTRYVIFLHDYWKEIAKKRGMPDWLIEESKLFEDLRAFFSTKPQIIHHTVSKRDALNIIETYAFSNKLPSKLKKAILKYSKFGETYIPKLIQETIDEWTKNNASIAEKLKIAELAKEDNEKIKQAFEHWKNELEMGSKKKDIVLSTLGIGATTASLTANLLGLPESILEALGISATIPSLISGFPVATTFFLAAALGFIVSKKKDLPGSLRKDFEKFSNGFLSAQRYWQELTLAQKELMCYELDKVNHLPLGTAAKELESRFMKSEELVKNFAQQIETGLGQGLEENLTAALLLKLDEAMAPFREECFEIGERLDSLEKRATKNEIRVKMVEQKILEVKQEIGIIQRLVPVAEFRQFISYLSVTLSGVQNRDELFATIANVKIKIDALKIPFVSFDQTDQILDQASRGISLFITGQSGSGKSRLLFEAIKHADTAIILGERTALETIRRTVLEAGGHASSVNMETIENITKEKLNQLFVWDNFPIGLANPENLSMTKNVLEFLSGNIKVRAVVSLNPKFYSKYSGLAKEIAGITTVNLHYNIDEFKRVFNVMGKLYLKEYYENRIGKIEEQIVGLLFAKWGLPKHIESYFEMILQGNQHDALEMAKRIQDKDYEHWASEQLDLLDRIGVDLSFLFAIKLGKILAEDNREEALESLQMKVFGNQNRNRAIEPWFDRSSGRRCFMHDSDLNALKFNEHAKSQIFSYIERKGFENIINETGKRLDESGWIEFSQFLAENTQYYDLSDMLSCMTRTADKLTEELPNTDIYHSLGRGIGPIFLSLSNNERRVILDYSKKNSRFSLGLGSGIGRPLISLMENKREHEIHDVISAHPGVAVGVGMSFGEIFWDTTEETKNGIMNLLRIDSDLAFGVGGIIGLKFNLLSANWKIRILKMAWTDDRFAEGLGNGFAPILAHLAQPWKNQVFTLAMVNTLFARGLGTGFGFSFSWLTEDLRNEAFNLLRKSRDFAEGFGIGVGQKFSTLVEDLKIKFIEIAKTDPEFADGLGKGFAANLDYFRIWKTAVALAKENDNFASGLGYGFGRIFDSITENWKNRIIAIAETNERFAGFLGCGIGAGFYHFSDNLKNRVVDLVTTNKSFAFGFGCGVMEDSFDRLSEDWKLRMIELTKTNKHFADGSHLYGINNH